MAEVALRFPPGITKAFVEKQLVDRTAAFHRATGTTIAVQVKRPAGNRP